MVWQKATSQSQTESVSKSVDQEGVKGKNLSQEQLQVARGIPLLQWVAQHCLLLC